MWEQVFLPVFEAIATKLREQLRFARQKDPNASSIWLYGGGADQPMLRPYLQQHVIDLENQGAEVRWILNGKAK
jgi:Tfp pilus assembly PilM family ATPase